MSGLQFMLNVTLGLPVLAIALLVVRLAQKVADNLWPSQPHTVTTLLAMTDAAILLMYATYLVREFAAIAGR